jgi:hypothetical protein
VCVRVQRLLYICDGWRVLDVACMRSAIAFYLSVSNNAPLPYSPSCCCVVCERLSLARSSTTVCLSEYVCVMRFVVVECWKLIEKPFPPRSGFCSHVCARYTIRGSDVCSLRGFFSIKLFAVNQTPL